MENTNTPGPLAASLAGSLKDLELRNLEDFVAAMRDGTPPDKATEIAMQGGFLRNCIQGLSEPPPGGTLAGPKPPGA